MLPLLVLLGTIAGAWYLLIVRPQKDQQTRHGRIVDQLKVGDHVLSVGGIYGRVVALDGPRVELELAPGLTSHMTTDAIARIVQDAQAPPSLRATPSTHGAHGASPSHRQATEPIMEQQQQPPQSYMPQFSPPQASAPHTAVAQHVIAQPAMPQPAMTPTGPSAPIPAPVPVASPAIAPAEPVGVGASIPTFRPRPWGDLQPRTAAPMPQAVSSQVASELSAPAWSGQLPALPQLGVHTPFAPTVPVTPATTAPTAAPVMPALSVATPPALAVSSHAVVQQTSDVPAPPVSTRRVSQAPQGMGSSLRLDDPSIRDTVSRAREERAGLAVEYRKLTAPLVDTSVTSELHTPASPAAHGTALGAPVVHAEPASSTLFAAPGAPAVHPVSEWPGPARPAPDIEHDHGMPRPVIAMPAGGVDPALRSHAFQHRTPYAPQVAQAQPPAPHVHA